MLQRIAMAEDEAPDTVSAMSASNSDTTQESETGSVGSSTVFGSEKRSTSASADSGSSSSPSGLKDKLPFHRKNTSRGDARKQEKDSHMARWLQGGNVIYKSVGLGLMDLAVGIRLIQFAKEKGVGTHVAGF